MSDIKKIVNNKSYEQLTEKDIVKKLQEEINNYTKGQAGAKLSASYEVIQYAVDDQIMYQKYREEQHQSQSPKEWAAHNGYRYVELNQSVLAMSDKDANQLEHDLHAKYRGQNVIVEVNDFVYELHADDVMYFPSYSSDQNPNFAV